jgi:hypothetical protein
MDRAGNVALGFNAMSGDQFSSSMTVDPKDDCTFGYTQEYYLASGSFNWATHVGAFRFDNCRPGANQKIVTSSGRARRTLCSCQVNGHYHGGLNDKRAAISLKTQVVSLTSTAF